MSKIWRFCTFAACLFTLVVSCSPLYSLSQTERVLELVNIERVKAGVRPLKMNTELTACAQKYATYLGEGRFFGHVGPDGSTVVSRNFAAGYSDPVWLGENIAAGFFEPEAAVAAWMDSLPHRSNILDPNFAEIGIATTFVTGSPYGRYWAQEFGVKACDLLGSDMPSESILQKAGRARSLVKRTTSSRGYDGVVSAGGLLDQPHIAKSDTAGSSIPLIDSVSPNSACHGALVRVSGKGFGNSGTLRFGGLIAPVDSWSDKMIVARVPTGAISAGVTVANDVGIISMGVGFRVLQLGAGPTAPIQKAETATSQTVE